MTSIVIPASYPDASTLATISGLTVAAAITMLAFRLQRELSIRASAGIKATWVPPADRLLMGALLIASLGVLLPLILLPASASFYFKLPSAASAASTVLLAMYPLAIFSHYDLRLFSRNAGQPDRSHYNLLLENLYVMIAMVGAMAAALYTWWR